MFERTQPGSAGQAGHRRAASRSLRPRASPAGWFGRAAPARPSRRHASGPPPRRCRAVPRSRRRSGGQRRLDQVPRAEHPGHVPGARAGRASRAQADHRPGSEQQDPAVAGADRRENLPQGHAAGVTGPAPAVPPSAPRPAPCRPPARTAPSGARSSTAAGCGRWDRWSNTPCAPWSRPSGPSRGWNRLSGRPWPSWLAGLLGVVAGAGQVPVQQRGSDPVGQDRGRGARPDPVLPPAGMIGGVQHAAGGHLGLVDRRHRLRVPGQPGAHPGELRRVHGRHLHDRDLDARALVQQLAAQRGGEPVDGVLRAAVGRLQRDAPRAQGGARPGRWCRARGASSGPAPPWSRARSPGS